MTHHFFSPHRDDAILTFGGHITNLIARNESVKVHVIFGRDGYLRPIFLDKLRQQKINHPHLKKLILLLDFDRAVYEQKIDKLLQDDTETSLLELGILIRQLEERAVAKKTGYELHEYDFFCAFPLRGYKKFNETLKEDDYTSQKRLLVEESPILSQLLNPSKIKSSDDVKLYFPTGVGGHPDHIIMAKIGLNIASAFPDKVVFGQDLPYGLVQEWFCKSPLPFEKMEKNIVDINNSLQNKVSLLSYYESQLSDEDMRLAKIYPQHLGDLISREYKLGGDFASLVDNNIPVEIQYKFANV